MAQHTSTSVSSSNMSTEVSAADNCTLCTQELDLEANMARGKEDYYYQLANDIWIYCPPVLVVFGTVGMYSLNNFFFLLVQHCS